MDARSPELDSVKLVTGIMETSLANALPDQKFQFERHRYFVADWVDHVQGFKLVFNLAVGLKDSWGEVILSTETKGRK